MKLYLHSENAEKSAQYPVIVAPAGDDEFISAAKAEKHKDWKNAKGDPVQFKIVFKFGVAEVQDELARYMLERGIAHKSRLLRRVQQLFDAAGNAIGDVFDQHGQRVLLDARD